MDAIVILGMFAVFLLAIGMLPAWAGEYTYGPRYLLFLVPVLSLPALVFADALIDRWRTRYSRAWAVAAIVCLAYSAYLQVQVNRLGFWIYYDARSALEVAYSGAAADWFRDRHVGAVCADLRITGAISPRCRGFRNSGARCRRRSRSSTCASCGRRIDRGNWYWSLPREGRS